MTNSNAMLNGKQHLWELVGVAVHDARYHLKGLPDGASFQLQEWAAEPSRESGEPYAVWVAVDGIPMRIGFSREQVERFSRPTRSEWVAMKATVLDCLRQLATGEDTLVLPRPRALGRLQFGAR